MSRRTDMSSDGEEKVSSGRPSGDVMTHSNLRLSNLASSSCLARPLEACFAGGWGSSVDSGN